MYRPPPQDMSEAGLFTSGVDVNSRQLCDHVFDLGQHVLKYQAAMVNCFYRTQNDHVFPDRRFFLPACEYAYVYALLPLSLFDAVIQARKQDWWFQ